MIQFGTEDVYSYSLSGFTMTDGQFINNEHVSDGNNDIGRYGMWGSNDAPKDGYYATFCSYHGGCATTGMDFWTFSINGVYPSDNSEVVCGFYFDYPKAKWKNCPEGDNGQRMRYYIRMNTQTGASGRLLRRRTSDNRVQTASHGKLYTSPGKDAPTDKFLFILGSCAVFVTFLVCFICSGVSKLKQHNMTTEEKMVELTV